MFSEVLRWFFLHEVKTLFWRTPLFPPHDGPLRDSVLTWLLNECEVQYHPSTFVLISLLFRKWFSWSLGNNFSALLKSNDEFLVLLLLKGLFFPTFSSSERRILIWKLILVSLWVLDIWNSCMSIAIYTTLISGCQISMVALELMVGLCSWLFDQGERGRYRLKVTCLFQPVPLSTSPFSLFLPAAR